MKKDASKKTTDGEFEKAFTELASFLYEQYRKQKQLQQTLESINNPEATQSLSNEGEN